MLSCRAALGLASEHVRAICVVNLRPSPLGHVPSRACPPWLSAPPLQSSARALARPSLAQVEGDRVGAPYHYTPRAPAARSRTPRSCWWPHAEPATTAMALHGSGRRRHGHRAQQLAAMALCIAGRRCCSARRHGRARGRRKRGSVAGFLGYPQPGGGAHPPIPSEGGLGEVLWRLG